MKLKSSLIYYPLKFKFKAGTSRGVMTEKPSWFIQLENEKGEKGIGEASIIPNLSPEWHPEKYPQKLKEVVQNTNYYINDYSSLEKYPSIKFALETACADLQNQPTGKVFPGEFYNNNRMIPINGLIWMGDEAFMNRQIEEKLSAGFSCIKMKIGAIDFETEIGLLKKIRTKYSKEEIIIRVDANGAFDENNAFKNLDELSKLDIHSIEQPIPAGKWDFMAKLTKDSPIPIALDEELIGISEESERIELLETIKPQYIILKPSLMDGISGAQNWIDIANKKSIGWWITSALESNIGLNAIAQFCDRNNPLIPQGLGTGGLYQQNVECPLYIEKGHLGYNPSKQWKYNF